MDRKRRGRQKISMEKMKNESNLQVTFSKRRAGLFKKASELCTLCGVETALIVFSPGQKVYSFGHPSIDVVVNKYINSITNTNNPLLVNQALGAQPNPNIIQELNVELTYVQNLLDIEIRRAQFLKGVKKENQNAQNWWDVVSKDELNFQQLECLKAMMENVQTGITKEQKNIILEAQTRATMAYQNATINPYDAQANAFFAPFSNVPNAPFSNVPNVPNAPFPNVLNVPTTDGASPSGINPGPYDYQPGYF